MADSGNSAISGGLLVVIGIIVALAAVFLYMHYHGNSAATAPGIHVNIPVSGGK